jgi:hypothetical protein
MDEGVHEVAKSATVFEDSQDTMALAKARVAVRGDGTSLSSIFVAGRVRSKEVMLENMPTGGIIVDMLIKTLVEQQFVSMRVRLQN